MKNYFQIIFLFFTLNKLCAQEFLVALKGNPSLVYSNKLETSNANKTTTSTSLFLPFKEDFYYATSSKIPNQNLWTDQCVFINTGYAISPPSYGTATFDGLNRYGYPYTPNLLNLNASLPADTLTSQNINLSLTANGQTLQATDNIGISFYYQARGNGEPPELNDSLLLDFYKPQQKVWWNVWSQLGNVNSNTNDSVFKRGFLMIRDTAYLKDGFRFRFRNSATTCGDFDHWHLDYIILDKYRDSIADTLFDDLTFANEPTPLLKNYCSMPWEQFNAGEMALSNSVRIKNNGKNYITNKYDLQILKADKSLLHQYSGGANNLCPFKPSNYAACTGSTGYSTYPSHANPTFNYTFANMTDSADFILKHYLSGSATAFIENDTLVQTLKFRNYFALDDGNAEGGYFINGVQGKLAIKFTLNYTDTVQSVRIYFDPQGNVNLASTSYSFFINFYTDGGNGPGSLIFSEPATLPIFNQQVFKGVPEYILSTNITKRVLGKGTYYVGLQQKVAAGVVVGFDKNTDHSSSVYYDSGGGWTQSTFKGSPMINPVFGRKLPRYVLVAENKSDENKFSVYPIPANDKLVIENPLNQKIKMVLINALGQEITNQNSDETISYINTSNISNGIYFLIFSNAEGKIIHQQKIILQH